ncbi:MAG: hypothetical protein HC904_00045 [Blastochloris sp.]|nr:hypothetical protein [Blastochloris sp.]
MSKIDWQVFFKGLLEDYTRILTLNPFPEDSDTRSQDNWHGLVLCLLNVLKSFVILGLVKEAFYKQFSSFFILLVIVVALVTVIILSSTKKVQLHVALLSFWSMASLVIYLIFEKTLTNAAHTENLPVYSLFVLFLLMLAPAFRSNLPWWKRLSYMAVLGFIQWLIISQLHAY